MNMQPAVQSRSSNGYGRRKNERDAVTRSDNRFQPGKTNSSRTSFGVGGTFESPSRDRLIYLTTCLIGNQVEVQVVDGSIFSGIFHATNAEDFGIVLKMAHLIKDGSRGQKSTSDSKPPSRTLVVPAKDLVQVIAKGVPLTRDVLLNELQHEKQQELMTDSYISQSWQAESGRELARWVPDENDPECPELDNIFDGPWSRGWDQFEANATLFGVKSTFDEDLYTTKLEKGPQMRELEREAIRLAREIEGEDTRDLHLAEERGIQLDGNLDIDEETRFSSVYRGADDSGYNDIEDILLDSRNDETFGGPDDHTRELLAEPGQFSKYSSVSESIRHHDHPSIGHADSSYNKEDKDKPNVPNLSEVSKTEDSHLFPSLKTENSDKLRLSPDATAFDPSRSSSKGQEKTSSSNELPEDTVPPKTQGITSKVVWSTSSASSTSNLGGVTSANAGRGLSPSSSVGSLSSEKSSLNPHAKEFKFNPNAKSFTPSQTPLRPSSPVADSPFYYPANMTAATHMHGMPVGIGMGPSFAGQQPVIYNPHAAPMPQPYYHPNGPQYGQQMMMGQPRPVLYMPTYPPEPYKGREF